MAKQPEIYAQISLAHTENCPDNGENFCNYACVLVAEARADAHREAVEATKRLRMAINAIYGSGEHRACPRKCLICNLMSEVTKYDTWAAGGGNDN